MPNLPFASIDTGMGLDRTAFVLGGKKSVYENGAFDGVFRILNELTGDGLDYATDPTPKGQAARIVADHVRNAPSASPTASSPATRAGATSSAASSAAPSSRASAPSASPSRSSTGLRGRVEAMGDFYTELEERRETIVETLRNEEEAFRRTLSRSGACRESSSHHSKLSRLRTISGYAILPHQRFEQMPSETAAGSPGSSNVGATRSLTGFVECRTDQQSPSSKGTCTTGTT